MKISGAASSGNIPRISAGSTDGNNPIEAVPEDMPTSVDTSAPIQKNELESAVDKMNDVFDALATHLKFNFHEGTGKYYVSIVNENTNKVVREIPPRKFLDMVAYFEKQMKGLFIDETK